MYIYIPHTDPHPSRLEHSTSGSNDADSPIDLTAMSPRTPSLSFRGSIRKRHDSIASERFAGRSVSRPVSPLSKNNDNLDTRITRSQGKIAKKWYQLEDPSKALTVLLASIFIHVYYGLELTFGSFLAPFSVSSNVHMNSREAAQLASIFWAAFTFWRLFTIFYIGFTGPRLGIVINLGIIAAGTIVFVPWGYSETWALYAGTVLIGVGVSPIWASMFGFLESYFPVTSLIASAMMTCAAIGEFVYPAILAKYMECQSIVFVYIILICSVLVVTFFSLIFIITHYKMKPNTDPGRVSHH